MCIYIHIYIYIPLASAADGVRRVGPAERAALAVASDDFESQDFKSRVSDPRTNADVHFNMPFESSNLPVHWLLCCIGTNCGAG